MVNNVVEFKPGVSKKESLARALENVAKAVRAGNVTFVIGVYLCADGQVSFVHTGDVSAGEDVLKLIGCISWHQNMLNEVLSNTRTKDVMDYDGKSSDNTDEDSEETP